MAELRILLAGLLGGAVIFVMGAVNHMAFQLGDRAVQNVPSEETMKSAITEQKMEHGIYRFPVLEEEMLKDEEGQRALNERYKAGPNGMLILGRTGEDMMTGRELGLEFGSNVL